MANNNNTNRVTFDVPTLLLAIIAVLLIILVAQGARSRRLLNELLLLRATGTMTSAQGRTTNTQGTAGAPGTAGAAGAGGTGGVAGSAGTSGQGVLDINLPQTSIPSTPAVPEPVNGIINSVRDTPGL